MIPTLCIWSESLRSALGEAGVAPSEPVTLVVYDGESVWIRRFTFDGIGDPARNKMSYLRLFPVGQDRTGAYAGQRFVLLRSTGRCFAWPIETGGSHCVRLSTIEESLNAYVYLVGQYGHDIRVICKEEGQ
jgi:hypothetical protein